jgi:hypothetical protein
MPDKNDWGNYHITDPTLTEKYNNIAQWTPDVAKKNSKDCHELWRRVCNTIADLELCGETHDIRATTGGPMVNLEATKNAIERIKKQMPEVAVGQWVRLSKSTNGPNI